MNKIAPVFSNIQFNTKKQIHFEKTVEVCKLITLKGYKTSENLKNIVDLAWDNNKLGVNQKISKYQYLSKIIPGHA